MSISLDSITNKRVEVAVDEDSVVEVEAEDTEVATEVEVEDTEADTEAAVVEGTIRITKSPDWSLAFCLPAVTYISAN